MHGRSSQRAECHRRRTAEDELPRIAREEAADHHPFAIVDENLHAGAVDKDPQALRLPRQ